MQVKRPSEIDLVWYGWSVFDKILLKFERGGEFVIDQSFENATQLRLGVYYDMTEDWQLRMGYLLANTPQPLETVSPFLPDNDRHDFSIGLGYTYLNYRFDVAYTFVDMGSRNTIRDGEGRNSRQIQ